MIKTKLINQTLIYLRRKKMKSSIKKTSEKAAFTIIELLTVMSIIVILMGLLVPALNKVKRYAKDVKQKAQFYGVNTAIEFFNNEWEDYPPSDWDDHTGPPPAAYCGAMKLAEAMVGQDMLGFHPNSSFRMGDTGLYPTPDDVLALSPAEYDVYVENLKSRRRYLQLESADATKLKHIYGWQPADTTPFTGEELVLCDVYSRVTLKEDPDDDYDDEISGKSGMPILYYKANTSNNLHDVSNLPTLVNDYGQIYNFWDNHMLLGLGLPWNPDATVKHPLYQVGAEPEGEKFYEITWNTNITTAVRPYNQDSYILISAGFDGLYGTDDDIFNYQK